MYDLSFRNALSPVRKSERVWRNETFQGKIPMRQAKKTNLHNILQSSSLLWTKSPYATNQPSLSLFPRLFSMWCYASGKAPSSHSRSRWFYYHFPLILSIFLNFKDFATFSSFSSRYYSNSTFSYFWQNNQNLRWISVLFVTFSDLISYSFQ